MSEFEQTVVIRKAELHRLDLTNLEQILSEIHELKRQKSGLQLSESLVERFYSALKSVSTEVPQLGGSTLLNQTAISSSTASRTVQASSYVIRK